MEHGIFFKVWLPGIISVLTEMQTTNGSWWATVDSWVWCYLECSLCYWKLSRHARKMPKCISNDPWICENAILGSLPWGTMQDRLTFLVKIGTSIWPNETTSDCNASKLSSPSFKHFSLWIETILFFCHPWNILSVCVNDILYLSIS